VGTALLWRVLLHYFDPVGCDEWDLRGRPLIRAGMPVLIDEDLRFEDAHAPAPGTGHRAPGRLSGSTGA